MSGRAGVRDDQVSITAQHAAEIQVRDRSDEPFEFTLDAAQCTPENLRTVREILAARPGPTRVRVKVQDQYRTTTIDLGEALGVTVGSSLYADLKGLLGADVVQ